MFTPSVPLPPYGLKIDIVSLPESWLRLSDQAEWDKQTQALLQRIGMVCQRHIRNIMQGIEPRRDGTTLYFQEATGRGVQSIQWEIVGNGVEIFADSKTKTKGGTSYLVYQNYGNASMPMRWLVGKTIPFVLIKGLRANPKTGTIVHGVTRFKFAGAGSRYAGAAGAQIAQTKKVGQEALDGQIHFRTITEATFSQRSEFNPTGFRWWLPSRSGLHFFEDGIYKGLEEASTAIEGLAFRIAGGAAEPEIGTELTPPGEHYTEAYQALLDSLEREMETEGIFPYGDKGRG